MVKEIAFDPDRVIRFAMPEGAYRTFMSVVYDLRAEGWVGDSKKWSWQWKAGGGDKQFGLIDGRYTYYAIIDGEEIIRLHKMSFMKVDWLYRGEGLGHSVMLKCHDERLWDIGVYRKLLDEIITIWPETRADIERSLGIGEEEPAKGTAEGPVAFQGKKRVKPYAIEKPEDRKKLVDEFDERRANGEKLTQEQFVGEKGITARTFRKYRDEFYPKSEAES